jgi:hypothetical protein
MTTTTTGDVCIRLLTQRSTSTSAQELLLPDLGACALPKDRLSAGPFYASRTLRLRCCGHRSGASWVRSDCVVDRLHGAPATVAHTLAPPPRVHTPMAPVPVTAAVPLQSVSRQRPCDNCGPPTDCSTTARSRPTGPARRVLKGPILSLSVVMVVLCSIPTCTLTSPRYLKPPATEVVNHPAQSTIAAAPPELPPLPPPP